MNSLNLVVALSLKDMLTQKWNKVVFDVASLKDKLKDNNVELTQLENRLKRFEIGSAVLMGY